MGAFFRTEYGHRKKFLSDKFRAYFVVFLISRMITAKIKLLCHDLFLTIETSKVRTTSESTRRIVLFLPVSYQIKIENGL